jgi:hypothetical protein
MSPDPKDEDLQRYYEMQLAMFASEGWRHFTEQVREMRASTNDIYGVKPEDLRFRQGELSVMDWILAWPQRIKDAYESGDEEEKARAE